MNGNSPLAADANSKLTTSALVPAFYASCLKGNSKARQFRSSVDKFTSRTYAAMLSVGVSSPKRRRRLRRIPKAKRREITRDEYNDLVDMLNDRGRLLESIQRSLEIQFARIAQMQMQLDALTDAKKRSA